MKYFSSLILLIIYIVGYIGLHSEYQTYFLKLTPWNLIISALIIFFKPIKETLSKSSTNEKLSGTVIQKTSLKTIFTFLAFYFSFWLIELIGVYSSFPFGCYYYGDNLGFKILDIPLIIGLNWLLLLCVSEKISEALILKIFPKILTADQIFKKITKINLVKSLITASIMLFIDILIEQHAARLGYWFWQDNIIPVNNYLSWFFISFTASLILKALDLKINISFIPAFGYFLILISFFLVF